MVVFAAATIAAVLAPHVTVILSMACGGLALFIFLLGVVLGFSRDPGKRRDRRFVMFHAAALLASAGAMFALYSDRYFTQADPVRSLDQTEASVKLETLDYPTSKYGKFYYPVRILELDGQPVEPFQVRLSCSEALECEPCCQVACRVKFYLFSSGEMYSTYSSQLAEGNLLGAYPLGYNEYEYIPDQGQFPIGRLLPLMRRYAARSLERCLSGDEAKLLQTALLGQDSQLPDQIYIDFRQIGCSHMLAVSGLHMTLVGAFLNLILAMLPIPNRLRGLLGAPLLFIYLLLTGFPASAVRSYIMYVACSLAASTYQLGDTLSSLGAAVSVICFTNPFAGGSVGFALSVMATAGIAILSPGLEAVLCPKKAGPLRKYTAGTLATSMSATLFTLPVQVAVFRGFPLLTLVSNLLLLPIFTALLYAALPLLLAAMLDPFGVLIRPLAFCCGLLARVLLKLSHWMAGLPNAYLGISGTVTIIALAALMLTVPVYFLCRSTSRGVLITLLITVAVGLPIYHSFAMDGCFTIAVCGDSSSACVVAMGGRQASVLSMGTFNSGLARQIMTQRNIPSLESILIRGRQDYNAKSMASDLLSNYRPETVWLSGRTYAGKDLRYPGVSIETVPDGDIFQPLPGIVAQAADGKLLIWVNNRKIVLAMEECSGDSCDLLITNQALPQIDAGATLFLCDDGNTAEEAQAYSQPVLVYGQDPVYVDISPEGLVVVSVPKPVLEKSSGFAKKG